MRFCASFLITFVISCGYGDGADYGTPSYHDDPSFLEEEEEQLLPVPTDAVYEEPTPDESAGGFVDLSSLADSTTVIGRGTSDLEVIVEAAGGDRYLCPIYDCIDPARQQPLPGNRTGCVNFLLCRASL